MNEQKLMGLQLKLNYRFNNLDLLKKSLTHSSYANENPGLGIQSNERLEFLGDSLLGMTVALLIYEKEPELSEGRMTKLRAELVCEKSLAKLAQKLDIGAYLLLGRGEENCGGRNRPSILSDTFESVLAAMYIDGGFSAIEQFVSGIFKPLIENPVQINTDYKTMLQEMVQVKPGQSLVYEKTDEYGPDHDKTFIIKVRLNGRPVGVGKGKSIKSAEQEAAKVAVNTLVIAAQEPQSPAGKHIIQGDPESSSG